MKYPVYELQLKPSSSWISDLTADIIFGHLCWTIKYQSWEDVLKKFLEEMTDKPIFVISDVIPANRITKPLSPRDWLYGPDTNIKRMIKTNKEYKDIEYIPTKDFFDIYNNYSEETIHKAKNRVEKKHSTSIVKEKKYNGNIIDRNSGTTWENSIYSLPLNYLISRSLSLYVKIINKESFDKYNIGFLLKLVFETWIWAKKSTGKWVFEIQKDWEEKIGFENENWTHQVLLSNCIPSSQDSINGAYQTYTKFGKLGEEYSLAGKNFYKKPVIFLKRWSCFENNKKWYMGSMIKNIDVDEKWIYQYGYWFVVTF